MLSEQNLPAAPREHPPLHPSHELAKRLKDIPGADRARLCYKCGKCTSACPVAELSNYDFRPHELVCGVGYGLTELVAQDLWACTTCGRCGKACPMQIDTAEVVRGVRAVSPGTMLAHKGINQSMQRLQATRVPDRSAWLKSFLTSDRINAESDTMVFVGCTPLWDAYYNAEVGFEGKPMVAGAVRLLDALGQPGLLATDEVCCGHDLLWSGDIEGFRALAARQQEYVKARGVKRMVVLDPECYRTFAHDYPRFFPDWKVDVKHVTEVVAQGIRDGKLKFRQTDRPVTYHDPCRLGHHSGIYDAPRELLRALSSNFREMEHSRETSYCCGVGAWAGCTPLAKAQRGARLEEAGRVAEVMVTACPKCNIHFRCSLVEPGAPYRVQVADLLTLAGGALV